MIYSLLKFLSRKNLLDWKLPFPSTSITIWNAYWGGHFGIANHHSRLQETKWQNTQFILTNNTFGFLLTQILFETSSLFWVLAIGIWRCLFFVIQSDHPIFLKLSGFRCAGSVLCIYTENHFFIIKQMSKQFQLRHFFPSALSRAILKKKQLNNLKTTTSSIFKLLILETTF